MKIVPFYLVLGLLIGLSMIYLIAPEPKIIKRLPVPDKGIVYIDDNNVCYSYEKQIIDQK